MIYINILILLLFLSLYYDLIASEIQQKGPAYIPKHHRNILKLYEECLKSEEGLRFKKSDSYDYPIVYNDY